MSGGGEPGRGGAKSGEDRSPSWRRPSTEAEKIEDTASALPGEGVDQGQARGLQEIDELRRKMGLTDRSASGSTEVTSAKDEDVFSQPGLSELRRSLAPSVDETVLEPQSDARRRGGAGLRLGDRLGPYVLQRELGRGGMGVVFLGYDARIQRQAAIKTLGVAMLMKEEALPRFLREARALGRLSHPNVVGLIDASEEDGLHYLAMEFVRGRDLEDLIWDRDRVAYREAAEIVAGCADGLEAAHSAGVLHRDIKPSNILIAEDGRPLLTDFGLARLDERASLTGTGNIMGTPVYFSPEMISGSEPSRASDIYALGAVLYKSTLGMAPYKGKTVHSILLEIMRGPPTDVRKVDRDFPEALAAIVDRAMAREPEGRYQSGAAMAADLRRFLGDGPRGPRRRRWKPRDRFRLGLLLVLLSVFAAIVCRRYWSGPGEGTLKPVTRTPELDQVFGVSGHSRGSESEGRALLEKLRDRARLKIRTLMASRASIADRRRARQDLQGAEPDAEGARRAQEALVLDPLCHEAWLLRVRVALAEGALSSGRRSAMLAEASQVIEVDEAASSERSLARLLRGRLLLGRGDAAARWLARRDWSHGGLQAEDASRAELALYRLALSEGEGKRAVKLMEDRLARRPLAAGDKSDGDFVAGFLLYIELLFHRGEKARAAALAREAVVLGFRGGFERYVGDSE